MSFGPPLPPRALGCFMRARTDPVLKVELFLDMICPFSKRMFETVNGGVCDRFKDVQFVVQQVVQPWHPQSACMHEAVIAVKQVRPEAELDFMARVFADQDAFTDVHVEDLSRVQLYDKLAPHAEAVGVAKPAFLEQLALQREKGPNHGNLATQALKWTVKHHRSRGVHVTPTVFINDIEANAVSSGWNAEQWAEMLVHAGAAKL